MKATKTWIVVADGAHARIALNEGPGTGIKPALDHEFAASHAPSRDFVSDRPGQYPDRGGLGTHRFAPKTDRREHEKTLFAQDVVGIIEDAAKQHAFDNLVLVAPPAALGRLREALSERTRALVSAEVGKDLTHVPIHELHGHLQDVVRI
jgi:protein required for attachment to host cells